MCLWVSGCKNLDLKGKYSTDQDRGIAGGTNEIEVRYKTIKTPFPIIFSSRAIHDMAKDKPVNVAGSVELWFW